MKWLKRILIALALLVAAAVAVPFFLRLDDYIPLIEKEASTRLGEPVAIRSIQFGLLPSPHFTIDGVTAGKAEDILLGRITLTPDWVSLLRPTKLIKSIDLESVALTQRGIGAIAALGRPAHPRVPGEAPPVRVQSIRADQILIRLDTVTLGPFHAQLRLDAEGEPVDALMATRDGKLKLSVKPGKGNYLIDATARDWKLPVGPAVEFEQLNLRGVATANGADLSAISARLYGGTASGKASLAWQKELRLNGGFELIQVELKSLVPLLSPGTRVSGKLNARPVFSAVAPDASRMMQALHLESPFSVQNGVLYGVDILKAAARAVSPGATGGETHFEQLSGRLVQERGAYRFTQLRIASGALSAQGSLNISAKQQLSGRVNARLEAAGRSATVPLNIAGTVHTPLLYPSGGTVAGAAIGGVLMPGVGAGLGAKAGQAIEELLRKDGEKAGK